MPNRDMLPKAEPPWSEEELIAQAEAASLTTDPKTLKSAIEAFVDAQTFMCWVQSAQSPNGELPSVALQAIAKHYPAFFEHHHKPTRDLTGDLDLWLASTLPGHDQPWWPAVSYHGMRDPRRSRAFEYGSRTSNTSEYLPYEEWRARAWAQPGPTRSSSSRERTALPGLFADHYHIGSDSTIQGLREALAFNTFREVDDSPWPTAVLSRGDSQGHVQLRPIVLDDHPLIPPDEVEEWKEAMWQQREELSDLDVDTLDAMNAIWLHQAQSERHSAVATVETVLQMRGIQQKKGGRGVRGGYEPEQRREVFKTLGHLQSIWVTLGSFPTYEMSPNGKRKRVSQVVQSRAFVITDRTGQMRFDGYMDVDAFVFRPGDVLAHVLFGPGRQTALMSAMALRYHNYKQTWEKRLTRYLSWQWRCRAYNDNYMQPFKIITLLGAVGESMNDRRPIRTMERLEKTLETLLEDGVISGWQYDRWDENSRSQKGWSHIWQQSTILVEPPEVIREQYRKLEQKNARVRALPVETFGQQLESRRKALGLSQMQAAEQLGISQSYWSTIVKGKKPLQSLSTSLRTTLMAWLEG